MTTISYRDTGRTHGTPSAAAGIMHFFSDIADRWQKRQSERDLEALPFDMRKDLGWPAVDADKEAK